ncbi:hypothetical protein F2Q70_00020120 [Brassica cretica]|uniref:DUF223 domain-containing protein n=1 Tax=Brassica cretica TaxID=69181 RepID=A0A8S9GW16_BRACR|nr:hypothetical protein F2Q70_00020120 [Brassica cretica]
MSHLRRKLTTLVFIDDIKLGNNSYKLKVQVMKLWKLWRSKKVVSIEMVLEDATIVHVGALTEIYAKGNQTNKLNVILRDETASNLTCTLRGDYGKQVIHYVEENNNSIVVCVGCFACVTEYKGIF